MTHNYQLDQFVESVNVELLVQCVRSSKSTQTQHEALLVMASIAHLFPVCWNVQVPLQSIKQLKPGYLYFVQQYLLHQAMSIFTFMGDHLLQQDDSHTFQVITNTLNTLIPAIIQVKPHLPHPLAMTSS